MIRAALALAVTLLLGRLALLGQATRVLCALSKRARRAMAVPQLSEGQPAGGKHVFGPAPGRGVEGSAAARRAKSLRRSVAAAGEGTAAPAAGAGGRAHFSLRS